MTFDEFIAKWSGKPVDFDGVYPNQCMDLMHQYVYEVLGISDKKVLAAPLAYQAYTNNWSGYFTKIDNTPTGIPQKGDILFFGTKIGTAGHVCIVRDASLNSFNSFDANWPVGSLPHIQTHMYTGVLGWLRPKAQVQSNFYKGLDLTNRESMKIAVDILVRVQAGEFVEKSKYEEALRRPQELEGAIRTLQGKIDKAKQDLS